MGRKAETFIQAAQLTYTLLHCGRATTALGVSRLGPSSGFTSKQLYDFGHGHLSEVMHSFPVQLGFRFFFPPVTIPQVQNLHMSVNIGEIQT